jgi:hypothetical protein
MDAIHLTLAFIPLALYFLYLGSVNLQPTARVVGGMRDAAWLILGIMGLFIVGPLELFLPEAAIAAFGPWTWVLLIVFYLLGGLLVVLALRPRLVVYNITVDILRPVLVEIAWELDSQCRWSGDAVYLPQLGMHLEMESLSALRNVSLSAIGPRQSLEGWFRLAEALRDRLRVVRTGRNPRGYSLLSLALIMIALVAWRLIDESPQLAEQLENILRL